MGLYDPLTLDRLRAFGDLTDKGLHEYVRATEVQAMAMELLKFREKTLMPVIAHCDDGVPNDANHGDVVMIDNQPYRVVVSDTCMQVHKDHKHYRIGLPNGEWDAWQPFGIKSRFTP